jgi:hypothetical protein
MPSFLIVLDEVETDENISFQDNFLVRSSSVPGSLVSMETPATSSCSKGDAVAVNTAALGTQSICSVPVCAFLFFEFPPHDAHPTSASILLTLRVASIVRNIGAV